MKERLTMLVACLFLVVGGVIAQTKVNGTVVSQDDSEPVIGATVTVVGTEVATVTDANGRFSLTVPAGKSTLRISYIGMEPLEVSARPNMRIVLTSDQQALDEVIVVAYGTAKKGTFTGSAGTMKADKIEKLQVSDLTRALSGQVAGVQVISSNGQPGTSASIRVRGVSSINGSNAPLYVVDGVPFDGDLSSIPSSDIADITVLKDAASTSLYGARGANGIIMVTTKQGRQGKPVISVNARWGQNSRAVSNYDVISNPAQYLELEYGAIYNYASNTLGYDAAAAQAYANRIITTNTAGGNGYQIYTVPDGQYMFGTDGKLNPNATLGWTNGTYYYTPDDWENTIMKKALRQEYEVSMSGATEANNYYVSFSYLDDGGIVSGSSFQRASVRVRDEYKVNDWLKLGANVGLTHSKSFYPDEQTTTNSSGNAFRLAYGIAPIYPIYVRDAQGNIMYNGDRAVYDYGSGEAGRDRSYMSISNPAGQMQYDKSIYTMDILNSTWFAELKPMEGLTLTARLGYNQDNTNYDVLQNAYMGQFADLEGGAYQYHMRTTGFTEQFLANYTTKIADIHNLDFTLGYEGYQWKYRQLYGGATKLYNPESYWLDNAVNQKNNSGYQIDYATKGIFGRINYSYDDKYIAAISYRRDASSCFHPDNRWGGFWSGSVAWVISREKFMESTRTWLDNLKLKASYGQQGNDNLGRSTGSGRYYYYAYTDQYTMTGDASGFSDGTLAYKGNKDLTWEKSVSYNIGVDFAMLNNRLSGSIEYFGRQQKDMLYFKPVAGSLGYSQIPMNVGTMTNRGLEIDLSYDIIKTQNLSLNVNANATFLSNKIDKLHSDLKGKWIDGSRIYEEGNSMYRLYLPEWAGVDEETGQALYWVNTYEQETVIVDGEEKTVDVWYDADGNKIPYADLETFVGEKDRKILGRETSSDYTVATLSENRVATKDLLPDVYGGFGVSLNAYGFDASVQFAYQLGGQVLDYGYMYLMHASASADAGGAWHKDILNAWTPTNTITDVPRLNAGDRYTAYSSTRFLTSASYLSLNNVTVGYTLPKDLVKKIGLGSVRVYFVGDNLALFAKRKGLDPRQGFTSSIPYTYTQLRTISGGISVTF
ncbi:MAG: TonB-dependent receptor [Prevotella sp.]|nr:TonB-dependent receptor [Prevotella sp.]